MTDQTVVTILIAIITALMGWVGFSITAVLRGWMIPAKTHEREVGILKDQSREWRAAYTAEQGISQELRTQNGMLLEQGKTTAGALDTIATELGRARRDVAS